MYVAARDSEGNLFSRDITEFGDLNLQAYSEDNKYGISLNKEYCTEAIFNTKEEAEEQIYLMTAYINKFLNSDD